MDRTEAEDFIRSFYDRGYSDGRNAAAKSKDRMMETISGIPGVGPAAVKKIKEALENADKPS
jgi:hypothetical protein